VLEEEKRPPPLPLPAPAALPPEAEGLEAGDRLLEADDPVERAEGWCG
jgi:hypothetical protein